MCLKVGILEIIFSFTDHTVNWYCGGSLLRCDNWRMDLDEHIRSRINQSIATDCRTFRPYRPSLTGYKTVAKNCFVCSWRKPMWPKSPAISCYWLIDSATYLLIKMCSLHCKLLANPFVLLTPFISIHVLLLLFVQCLACSTVTVCHTFHMCIILYSRKRTA